MCVYSIVNTSCVIYSRAAMQDMQRSIKLQGENMINIEAQMARQNDINQKYALGIKELKEELGAELGN